MQDLVYMTYIGMKVKSIEMLKDDLLNDFIHFMKKENLTSSYQTEWNIIIEESRHRKIKKILN